MAERDDIVNTHDQMSDHGFQRTSCACNECVACCKRQPGPLAPGDFERIAAHLGEDRQTAKLHFWASPGALVMDRETGVQRKIGTITPRFVKGRCVFLDEQDRCAIHPVAPFGCAMFDTHMRAPEAAMRGQWLAYQQDTDEEYKRLRSELPFASTYKPTGY